MLYLLEEQEDIWTILHRQPLPVVLYGMGDGADKLLDACGRFAIPVQGVFASPGFVRGQQFRGFTVKTLDALEQELGDLVVLLAFATQRPEVLAQIDAVAARHLLLAPDLPVYGSTLFTLDYLREHMEDAQAAYALMADESSRRCFLDLLNYRLSGKPRYLRRCESAQDAVFDTILPLNEEETFVDAGAYNGDTVEQFVTRTGGRYRGIIALEPDRRNYAKLLQTVERLGLQNVRCLQAGAWSRDQTLQFAHRSGRHASLAGQGIETAMRSIDSVLAGAPATLIKYDVEGAEREALLGTRSTIQQHHPALIVSAYHRTGDLLSLPQLIHGLYPNYRIFLRHHPYIPAWDTNLYVIPAWREIISKRIEGQTL